MMTHLGTMSGCFKMHWCWWLRMGEMGKGTLGLALQNSCFSSKGCEICRWKQGNSSNGVRPD